ncbi:hypothetical protein PR001_g8395 [Phytophthora rubi]|uniref:Uncharacterized protein n=2 Tax=Phytophthora rubi TaxID=129364 RepID=A0A6A3NAQ0_9STRA|nr:hypothetical protein PR001_g8395 [Phytophthora rubi]
MSIHHDQTPSISCMVHSLIYLVTSSFMPPTEPRATQTRKGSSTSSPAPGPSGTSAEDSMEIGPSGTSAEDSMEIAGTLKKTHKKFNKEDDLILLRQVQADRPFAFALVGVR